jgi:hypothetical protein
MEYSQNLADSARRHLGAAISLHNDNEPGTRPGKRAVAGYLFGLAGELALKKMMSDSGMRPRNNVQKRDDPFYAHFPILRTLLRDNAQGRRQGELMRHANDAKLFQNWDTNMRYAPTKDIRDDWTKQWRSQAEALVQTMNL